MREHMSRMARIAAVRKADESIKEKYSPITASGGSAEDCARYRSSRLNSRGEQND